MLVTVHMEHNSAGGTWLQAAVPKKTGDLQYDMNDHPPTPCCPTHMGTTRMLLCPPLASMYLHDAICALLSGASESQCARPNGCGCILL